MKLRQTNIQKLASTEFDVCIIGGGINGAVSAAALSARGVRVALIDRGDFAGATSQESSNLAWGGIKYMETFEFGLVRSLCMARNRLIRAYPSTVQEIAFFMTHARAFRWPRWIVWLGAWLYWFIGGCFTRRPRLLSTRDIAEEEPIVELRGADGGVEYSTPSCTTPTRVSSSISFVRRSAAGAWPPTTSMPSRECERAIGGVSPRVMPSTAERSPCRLASSSMLAARMRTVSMPGSG